MKKTILAVAITGMFAASAQAANVYNKNGVKADVYGRMQFDIRESHKDTESGTNGVGSARMGFKAESVINENVTGIAKGEQQIASESSDESKFKVRHLFAGFKSDYGQLIFGQTDTPFYQSVAATDIFNTYGYEAFGGIESGRQEGQVIYHAEFDGFYVDLGAQFKDDDFEFKVGNPSDPDYIAVPESALDSAYSTTLGYKFGFGLDVYAGYRLERFEHKTTFAKADKKNYAVSASYTFEGLYLGAAYVGTDVEGNELTGYDVVAAYTFTDTKLYTGYARQEAKDAWIDELGSDKPSDAFKVGAQYSFNSNMKAWAEYKANGVENADDEWTVALQYNF